MPSVQHSFGSETMDSQWVYITSKGNTPTIPHGEPRFCMPKQRVRNGEWIKYPVEVLHESSPKVFKIVPVMQDEGLEVIIDRTCLFALDFMNGICIGSPLRFHDGFFLGRRNRRASNAHAATKLKSKWTWSMNQGGKTNLGNGAKPWTIRGSLQWSWASLIEHCHGISGFEV